MTELLTKIFIKGSDTPYDPGVREQYGTFASVVGVIVNILIASFKMIAGIISGSIAMVADSLNNYSDAGSSIVSFVSFKIAAKPADRDHPFGHARIEYICSMIVSFIILLVGFELFSSSISGLFEGEKELNVSIATYVVLGISILGKLWLAIFNNKIGTKINSGVIKATAVDSIYDCISTTAVLVCSIIIKFTNLWYLDSIVGIAISIMIFIAGVKILNETKNSLLGEAPTDELVESIKEIVSRYPEILGIHDMLVHNYGPNHYIASFHAEVDGSDDIYMLHDTIDLVEKNISEELGIIVTVHLDPIVTDDEEVAKLRDYTASVVSSLYDNATIHDFRTVIGQTHTNLIFDIGLPFEIKENADLVIKSVQDAIHKDYPNYFIVVTIDRV